MPRPNLSLRMLSVKGISGMTLLMNINHESPDVTDSSCSWDSEDGDLEKVFAVLALHIKPLCSNRPSTYTTSGHLRCPIGPLSIRTSGRVVSD